MTNLILYDIDKNLVFHKSTYVADSHFIRWKIFDKSYMSKKGIQRENNNNNKFNEEKKNCHLKK